MTQKIKWDTTNEDDNLIIEIVNRARQEFGAPAHRIMNLTMDLTATHLNGTPLDLPGLLAADPYTFLHDIGGICQHINRETGQLEDCFLPRTAKREEML